MKSEIILFPDEISHTWIDRMADAGINAMGIHLQGGEDAAEALKSLVVAMKQPEYRALLDYAAQRGLEIAYELHAASYLLPRDLFEEHPEYFRMNKAGQRVNDSNFAFPIPKRFLLLQSGQLGLLSLFTEACMTIIFGWMMVTIHAVIALVAASFRRLISSCLY